MLFRNLPCNSSLLRFQHNIYIHFLDTLWVEVTVESEMTMALVEQLAALPVPSSNGQVCLLKEIYSCMT